MNCQNYTQDCSRNWGK